uniref:Regulator of G-protein signaling 1 n=1 Tax=Salarias fasciatus TaxID=181472 RepID=A0A672F645_SALFA
ICKLGGVQPLVAAGPEYTPSAQIDRPFRKPPEPPGGQPSPDCHQHLFFCSLCAAGQLVFEDFLRTQYSEENLLFWLACEEYKRITAVTEMMAAATRIYTEFVDVDAPRQINIDCVTREEISENISQPGPNCFDRAQKLIHGLMENDCYPRFLKSEIYQALLEQAEQQ